MENIKINSIKVYMRNAFIEVFNKNQKMLDSYLETHRKKQDKYCWFIINVKNNFGFKERVFKQFMETLYINHPTFVISEINFSLMIEYISRCDSIDMDESELDSLDYVESLMAEFEGDNSKILQLFYDTYIHYSMTKFISRVDLLIAGILRYTTAKRDAKRASVILLKIPNFNSDVISCITSYISKEYKNKK